MFNEFYGLSLDPFRLSPDPRFCYRHRNFARAKAYMQYALHQGEGFVMVTGQPGTGKTTLIEDLLADPSTMNVKIARISSTQVAADDLLRMVAYAFDIDTHAYTKATTLLSLQAVLTQQMESGRNSLLIVDEAQNLPYESLEELRMITNLQLGARPLMQVFLVGQDALHALVSQPRMEQLRQRILAACRMEPLGLGDTREYLHHRLRCAGWEGRPGISGEAVWQLHEASGGIPRRINSLASRLLLHGYIEERLSLGVDDVRLVTDELEGELLIGVRSVDVPPVAPAVADPTLDLHDLAIEMPLAPVMGEILPFVSFPEVSLPAGPDQPVWTKAGVAEDASFPPAAEVTASLQGRGPAWVPVEATNAAVLAPSAEPSRPAWHLRPDPTAVAEATRETEAGGPAPDLDPRWPEAVAQVGDLSVADLFVQPNAAVPRPALAEPAVDWVPPPTQSGPRASVLPAASALRPAPEQPKAQSGDKVREPSPRQVPPLSTPAKRGGRRFLIWGAAAIGLVALSGLAVLVVRPDWVGPLRARLQPVTQKVEALAAKAPVALGDSHKPVGPNAQTAIPGRPPVASYAGTLRVGEGVPATPTPNRSIPVGAVPAEPVGATTGQGSANVDTGHNPTPPAVADPGGAQAVPAVAPEAILPITPVTAAPTVWQAAAPGARANAAEGHPDSGPGAGPITPAAPVADMGSTASAMGAPGVRPHTEEYPLAQSTEADLGGGLQATTRARRRGGAGCGHPGAEGRGHGHGGYRR